MKMHSSKKFATTIAIFVNAACLAQSPSKHASFPMPAHHQSVALENKKLPRSMPSNISVAGKPDPYAQEVLHIERATASDIHASTTGISRVSKASSVKKASMREQHSAPINFSYHSTGSGAGSAVSSKRR